MFPRFHLIEFLLILICCCSSASVFINCAPSVSRTMPSLVKQDKIGIVCTGGVYLPLCYRTVHGFFVLSCGSSSADVYLYRCGNLAQCEQNLLGVGSSCTKISHWEPNFTQSAPIDSSSGGGVNYRWDGVYYQLDYGWVEVKRYQQPGNCSVSGAKPISFMNYPANTCQQSNSGIPNFESSSSRTKFSSQKYVCTGEYISSGAYVNYVKRTRWDSDSDTCSSSIAPTSDVSILEAQCSSNNDYWSCRRNVFAYGIVFTRSSCSPLLLYNKFAFLFVFMMWLSLFVFLSFF